MKMRKTILKKSVEKKVALTKKKNSGKKSKKIKDLELIKYATSPPVSVEMDRIDCKTLPVYDQLPTSKSYGSLISPVPNQTTSPIQWSSEPISICGNCATPLCNGSPVSSNAANQHMHTLPKPTFRIAQASNIPLSPMLSRGYGETGNKIPEDLRLNDHATNYHEPLNIDIPEVEELVHARTIFNVPDIEIDLDGEEINWASVMSCSMYL